jgi:hypothetical protein
VYTDPIVEEVHKAREEYARQFNFNLRDMVADLQRKQRESGRKLVSFPPKRPFVIANPPVDPSSGT